jgi:hypothetical protein
MGLFNTKKNNNEYNLLSKEGILGYLKANLKNPSDKNVARVMQELVKPDANQQHLTKEGELPWGWLSLNKGFTDKIQGEYSYFLNNWLNSRKESPQTQYAALRSFVLYMEDARKLCYSKGECFAFWFSEIIASDDCILERKEELNELEQNFDKINAEWEIKQKELPHLEEKILKQLKQNEGILQSDFVKMFDSAIHNEVKEKLYFMDKNGQISRIKSGRSYILNTKQK